MVGAAESGLFRTRFWWQSVSIDTNLGPDYSENQGWEYEQTGKRDTVWRGLLKRIWMRPIFALLSLILLMAVACTTESTDAPSGGVDATSVPPASSSESSSSTPTPVPQSASAPAVRSGGSPMDGGVFYRLGNEPSTLDPHLTTDVASAVYAVEIFSGLMTINPDLAIVGDLAEGWDVSPDGTATTFRLRPGAKFHDGKPVTARDVKWSLERAADPATEAFNASVFLGDILGVDQKLAGAATTVSGVQVIDDRTLTITTDAPKAYFLSKMTYPVSFVLDQDNVQTGPAWILKPNGTGPFKLAEYSPGEVLRLTRFDGYHLGPAKLDEVEFLLSGGSSMLMYENDEIHVTDIDFSLLPGFSDQSNPLSADMQQAPPQFDVDYFGFNTTEPPFDDVKVRQAFNYAIDRQTLVTALLQDLVVPAAGILPPGFPGFNPNLEGYSYDPAKARQLISESKYRSGSDMPRITLTVPGSFGAPISPSIEALLAMWQEHLDVEIGVLQTEWAIFLEDLHQNRFQMYGGLGWVADYPDPENFLDVLFHSESNNNQAQYSNSQVDLLLERARVERDETARFDLYRQAEAIIVDDAAWVPLWHSNGGAILVKPQVRDYFLFPLIIAKYRYIYFVE
ncbi:MAG: ABC transporter substrate-binding protein [Chloroflexi bacterium]|nr:ABC transporter substrate-binding protein [Chloroflexota bacterium]